ncbi:MAG: hypothetical protein GF350_07675 [Chitinivibrionales bacterium]|nr:hypothetical protein [Chitinivibrionales bacterium]
MRIDTVQKNGFYILKVRDNVGPDTDLSKLKFLVEEIIEKGGYDIAVGFLPKSYLSSNSIAVLISCVRLLKENGGTLSVVGLAKNMVQILRVLNVQANIISTYDTEELFLEAVSKKKSVK